MRYHHWTYLAQGCDTALLNRFGTVMNNPLSEAVLDILIDTIPFLQGERRVTIAEDGTRIGIAIQHPRDTYSRKLGRRIASGRLLH